MKISFHFLNFFDIHVPPNRKPKEILYWKEQQKGIEVGWSRTNFMNINKTRVSCRLCNSPQKQGDGNIDQHIKLRSDVLVLKF